jgi:hypothetical protein
MLSFHFSPGSVFTISVPDPNLAKWGLFSAKSPTRGIFTGYTYREIAGQKFSGNIRPLAVSK